MREIEFRGKTNNNKDWVYGYYKRIGDKHYILEEQNKSVYDPKWEWIDWIEVDLKTVGQYTGQKDKNVKKIFEGDIVEYDHHYDGAKAAKAVVSFKNGCFVIFKTKNDYFYLGHENVIEIIGDVHTNPELIKEPIKVNG